MHRSSLPIEAHLSHFLWLANHVVEHIYKLFSMMELSRSVTKPANGEKTSSLLPFHSCIRIVLS